MGKPVDIDTQVRKLQHEIALNKAALIGFGLPKVKVQELRKEIEIAEKCIKILRGEER